MMTLWYSEGMETCVRGTSNLRVFEVFGIIKSHCIVHHGMESSEDVTHFYFRRRERGNLIHVETSTKYSITKYWPRSRANAKSNDFVWSSVINN